jgi:hypothetical protein
VKPDGAEAGGGGPGSYARRLSEELAGEGAPGVVVDRLADVGAAVADLLGEEGGEEAPSRRPGRGQDRCFSSRWPEESRRRGIGPRRPIGLGEAPEQSTRER